MTKKHDVKTILQDAITYVDTTHAEADSTEFKTFISKLIADLAPFSTSHYSWDALKARTGADPFLSTRAKSITVTIPREAPVRPLSGVTDGIWPVRDTTRKPNWKPTRVSCGIQTYDPAVIDHLIDRLAALKVDTRTGWNPNLEKGLPPFENYLEALTAIMRAPGLAKHAIRSFMMARMARGLLDIKNTLYHVTAILRDEFLELFNHFMDLAYGMRGQDTKIQGILATFDNFQRRENRHSTAAQMLGSRVFPLLREYDSLHNGYLDHLKSQSPDTPYGFLSRMRGIEAEVKEVVESMNDQPLASLTEEEAVVVNGTLALLGEMFIPTEGTFLFNYGHIPLYADGKGFMTLVGPDPATGL